MNKYQQWEEENRQQIKARNTPEKKLKKLEFELQLAKNYVADLENEIDSLRRKVWEKENG